MSNTCKEVYGCQGACCIGPTLYNVREEQVNRDFPGVKKVGFYHKPSGEPYAIAIPDPANEHHQNHTIIIPPGVACPNLTSKGECGIHDRVPASCEAVRVNGPTCLQRKARHPERVKNK